MNNARISNVNNAIKKLGEEFPNLNWNFQVDSSHELVSGWLGEPEEQVMICAFRGKRIDEPFHHQDFSFLTLHIMEIIPHYQIARHLPHSLKKVTYIWDSHIVDTRLRQTLIKRFP